MPGRSSLRGRTAASSRRGPWYERDGGPRLAHDEVLVGEHYPGLRYRVDHYARSVSLTGIITLRTGSGIPTKIATRVEFPEGYPNHEPRVYESAGRFPHEPDRHFFPDGRCCLWLRPESKWDAKNPDCLLCVLDETVLFFERQLIHDLYPDALWPGGERGHGMLGYAEYVYELLGEDEELLSALAPVFAREVSVGRNNSCPCGSGTKYKRCCLPRVEEIERRVGTTILRKALAGRSGA